MGETDVEIAVTVTSAQHTPPPDDATIRVINHQNNHAALGMIPPHMVRDLGVAVAYDAAQRGSALTAQPTAQPPFDTQARLWLTGVKASN